jgi:hypothetical protein
MGTLACVLSLALCALSGNFVVLGCAAIGGVGARYPSAAALAATSRSASRTRELC